MSRPCSKAGKFLARDRGAFDLQADGIGFLGAQQFGCRGTPPSVRPVVRLATEPQGNPKSFHQQEFSHGA